MLPPPHPQRISGTKWWENKRRTECVNGGGGGSGGKSVDEPPPVTIERDGGDGSEAQRMRLKWPAGVTILSHPTPHTRAPALCVLTPGPDDPALSAAKFQSLLHNARMGRTSCI